MIREAASGQGRTFDDIEAVRAWPATQDRCTGRIGVIGFCMRFGANDCGHWLLPSGAFAGFSRECPVTPP
jgi:hypothetical protein